MASVAESVARLTHPSSQTGRGNVNGPSAAIERGDWAIVDNGHVEPVGAAAALPVDGKAAIVASRLEPAGIIVHGPPGAVPAPSVELDPESRLVHRTTRSLRGSDRHDSGG